MILGLTQPRLAVIVTADNAGPFWAVLLNELQYTAKDITKERVYIRGASELQIILFLL